MRTVRPDVIQGWMYHGNLAALLMAPFAPGRPLQFWSVRQSLYDLKREKRGTVAVVKLGAKLSSRVDGIIYNSVLSRSQHEGIGFCGARSRVIDNGFDTAVFQPNSNAPAVVRAELALSSSSKLVGLIARYHPMKGHRDFLRAATRVVERLPDAHFVLVGWGVVADNPALGSQIQSLGLERHVSLLGERQDVAQLTAALDVAVSASNWGDAFPNSLGEAMSCGVPCIATDVGDARRILSNTGVIVPPGDVESMACAIIEMLTLDETKRCALGRAARSRVIAQFSLEDVANRYLDVYEER
jgi:glycosyltransferase involved in cell wall biosynthesis